MAKAGWQPWVGLPGGGCSRLTPTKPLSRRAPEYCRSPCGWINGDDVAHMCLELSLWQPALGKQPVSPKPGCNGRARLWKLHLPVTCDYATMNKRADLGQVGPRDSLWGPSWAMHGVAHSKPASGPCSAVWPILQGPQTWPKSGEIEGISGRLSLL